MACVRATAIALGFSGATALRVVAACMIIGGTLLMTMPLSRQWRPEPRLENEPSLFRSPAIRLLALDGLGASSGLDLPLCEEAFARAYARRFGLDLDVEGMELSEYKHLRFMYPQGDFPDGGLLFRAGGSLTPKGSTLLPQTLSLRVRGGYMVPLKTGGRYLGYELASGSPQEFSMTGFDLDVVGLGKH